MSGRRVVFVEVPGFYAAVERQQDPELAERPVIVGGDPRKRGLVQSATLDAQAVGVCVDMPMVEALRLCPSARAVRTEMNTYREVSRRLLVCFRREAGQLEAFGLGGAYFEMAAQPEAERAVQAIREAVREELGLPLRAGIGSGKYVARVAAEQAGEDALHAVPPGTERAFLEPLPVERLDGVGRKTAATLAELGAQCIGDVQRLGREPLERAFGTHGLRIFSLACALEDAPVRGSRHPQSLSRETTLGAGETDRAVIAEQLLELARQLAAELARQGLAAGRVGLKVRYADQGTQTRSRALSDVVTAAADLHAAALTLLDRTQVGSRALRGVGLQLGKLAPAAEADRQLELFRPGE